MYLDRENNMSEDLIRKRLVPHQINFPSSTPRRMIKYVNKGYYVCGGALADFAQQINELKDLKEEVLYID
jgi:hypothetical protein